VSDVELRGPLAVPLACGVPATPPESSVPVSILSSCCVTTEETQARSDTAPAIDDAAVVKFSMPARHGMICFDLKPLSSSASAVVTMRYRCVSPTQLACLECTAVPHAVCARNLPEHLADRECDPRRGAVGARRAQLPHALHLLPVLRRQHLQDQTLDRVASHGFAGTSARTQPPARATCP